MEQIEKFGLISLDKFANPNLPPPGANIVKVDAHCSCIF